MVWWPRLIRVSVETARSFAGILKAERQPFADWGNVVDGVPRQRQSLADCSPDDPIFPCPRCERCYKHLRSMKKHLKLECGVEPQFPCPLCDYKAKQKISLQKHLTKHH
ncbi:uncharacterized protein [Bemisia tabaci]|uniref:uncharacterized protein n=1 Tax=Bemisia tabaci TaxID=7038 RepID=UPI003B28AB8F